MSLRKIIRNNNKLLRISAFIYNIIHLSYPLRYIISGKLRCSGVFLKNTSFIIRGKGSRVAINSNTQLRDCCVKLYSTDCSVSIGGGGRIVNTVLYLQDNKSSIHIGKNFTMESGHIASTEGEAIVIGDNCMFSNDIEIRNGDSHSIIDIESGIRTNAAKSVRIGNHVWLTAHCRVLKGATIPDECIIGNSSVVSRELETSYAIYGGFPLKLLHENRTWNRKRLIQKNFQ